MLGKDSSLSNCPFCNSKEIEIRAGEHGLFFVFCKSCGGGSGYAMFRDDAIRYWNRRVSAFTDNEMVHCQDNFLEALSGVKENPEDSEFPIIRDFWAKIIRMFDYESKKEDV